MEPTFNDIDGNPLAPFVDQQSPALGSDLNRIIAAIMPLQATLQCDEAGGYFLASEDDAEKHGLREFRANRHKDNDEAYNISSAVHGKAPVKIKTYLIRRDKLGRSNVVAEFLIAEFEDFVLLAPVAIAGNADFKKVFHVRMHMLAASLRESLHKKVWVLSTEASKRWGDQAAIAQLGFDTSMVVSSLERARMLKVTDGQSAVFALAKPDVEVPMNPKPVKHPTVASSIWQNSKAAVGWAVTKLKVSVTVVRVKLGFGEGNSSGEDDAG